MPPEHKEADPLKSDIAKQKPRSEPNPVALLMPTKQDLEAAETFMDQHLECLAGSRRASMDNYEVTMWTRISEMISLTFVWLGYIPLTGRLRIWIS